MKKVLLVLSMVSLIGFAYAFNNDKEKKSCSKKSSCCKKSESKSCDSKPEEKKAEEQPK
jgi:hypothetical protein